MQPGQYGNELFRPEWVIIIWAGSNRIAEILIFHAVFLDFGYKFKDHVFLQGVSG